MKIRENETTKIINLLAKKTWGEVLLINGQINPAILVKLAPLVKKEVLDRGKVMIKVISEEKGPRETDEPEVDAITVSEQGEIIIPQIPEDFARFVTEYLLNEFESINHAIDTVLRGQHNDRIAKFQTAVTKYRMAMNTGNADLKMKTLHEAESDMTEALAQLSLTTREHIEQLNKIPKSTHKKVFFSGMKLSHAKELVAMSEDALMSYELGVKLLLRIDAEMDEMNRIKPNIEATKRFLEATFMEGDKGKRIWELTGDDLWTRKPQELFLRLADVEKALDNGSKILMLEMGEY